MKAWEPIQENREVRPHFGIVVVNVFGNNLNDPPKTEDKETKDRSLANLLLGSGQLQACNLRSRSTSVTRKLSPSSLGLHNHLAQLEQPSTNVRSLSTRVTRQASPCNPTFRAKGTQFESVRRGSSPCESQRSGSSTRDSLRCSSPRDSLPRRSPRNLRGNMAPRTYSSAFTASRNSVSRLTLGCPRDASPASPQPRWPRELCNKQNEVERQESLPTQMAVNKRGEVPRQWQNEVARHRQHVQSLRDLLHRGGSSRASF